MPVTVQIPVTEEFQEAVFPTLDYTSGILTVGNFLYVIGGLAPGWIVQLDKQNLSSSTVLNFPNDGKHISPIDLCYAQSTGHIYVLFRNVDFPPDEPSSFQLTVGRISTGSPATVLSDFVDLHGTYLPQAGSITTDNAYLYVAVWQPSNLLRYRLSDANLTATPLTGFTKASSVRYSGNKLFLSGWNAPSSQWVMRMGTDLSVEQSATFNMPDGQFLEGQFAVSASHLWAGNRSANGIVKRILKTDLTNMADIPTRQLSNGASVDSDGSNVWALFENGKAARINPSDSTVALYTVNEGQSYQREICGDGTYIFTAT